MRAQEGALERSARRAITVALDVPLRPHTRILPLGIGGRNHRHDSVEVFAAQDST